jgi:hypothetical protein
MIPTANESENKPKAYDNFELTFMAAEPPAGGSNVMVRYANGTRMGLFRYGEVAAAARTLAEALQKGAPAEETIRSHGGALFDALFNGNIHDAWLEHRLAAQRNRHGVRLCIMSEIPALIAVPWEYLHNREHGLPLSLDADVSVVRALPLMGREPLAVEGDLRVLVLLSSPNNLAKLDVEREWTNLTAATAAAAISLIRVEPTFEALQGALRQHMPHVVHFVGHGGFPFGPPSDTAEAAGLQGALAFCSSDGTSAIVGASDVAMLLSGCGTLRLVYLSACQGAVTGTASAFAGVAQQLLHKGTPAVLAMQAPIREDYALRFSQEFYRALADGYGVEQAIREGRTRVKEVADAWGIPTFYFQGVEPFAIAALGNDAKAQRLWQKVVASPSPDSRRRLLKEVLKFDPAHGFALAEQRKLDNIDTAAQLYAAGEAYYQQQQWREAYRNLEEAERLAPNFRQARALLAEILGKLGGRTPRPTFDFSAQVEEYRPILNAMQEGRLVPFLGWEVSQFGRPATDGWVRGHSLPSAAEAARELTQRLQNVQHSDFSLLQASQYTTLIEGEIALYEYLSALYGGDHRPTILHRLLAELPGRLRAKGYPSNAGRRYVIFTIALDDLLERAFVEVGQPYHLFAFSHRKVDENGAVLPGHFIHVPPVGEAVSVTTPNDYTGHDTDQLPIVVKLSGRLLTAEPDSVLVTEDQYLEYLPAQEIGALLPATLLRQINRRSFLFFGYSLQPWHFRLLWQRMRFQKRRLHDRSWAVEAEFNTIEHEFWRSHDIVPIIAAPEGVVAYVSAWLDRLEAQV